MGSRMKIPWLYLKYNPGSENCDVRYCGADVSEEVPKMDKETQWEPPSFFAHRVVLPFHVLVHDVVLRTKPSHKTKLTAIFTYVRNSRKTFLATLIIKQTSSSVL